LSLDPSVDENLLRLVTLSSELPCIPALSLSVLVVLREADPSTPVLRDPFVLFLKRSIREEVEEERESAFSLLEPSSDDVVPSSLDFLL